MLLTGEPVVPLRETWFSGASATLPTIQSEPLPVVTRSAPSVPQTWLLVPSPDIV
ncbi:MAG: hypothetical protein QM722_11065 [Piscinibacter sp.]